MVAVQAEVAAHGRQDAAVGGVPAGQVRQRGARHPARHGERTGVGGGRVAGAQDRAVRPQRGDLLGPGHHVLVVRREERQQRAVVVALHGAPGVRPELLDLGVGRRPGCQGAAEVVRALGSSEPRSGRDRLLRRGRGENRGRGAGEVERLADEPDVRLGRGGRVVLHQETGERRRQVLTGFQPPACRLQGGEGVLVLASPGGQVTAETRGRPAGAGRQTVHVERIGRPRDHRCRAGEHAPRGQARLGGVLAHRERRAEAVAVERPDVQVLAHVQLVGAQRPGCREGDVVGVHDIHLTGDRSVVEHLDVPGPGRAGRVEGEGHLPAEPGVRPADDDQCALPDAHGGARPRTEHRPRPVGRAVAKPQLQQSRGEGRGGVLHQLDPVGAEGGRRAAVHDDRTEPPWRPEDPGWAVRDRPHRLPAVATRTCRRRGPLPSRRVVLPSGPGHDVCCRAQAAAHVVSMR